MITVTVLINGQPIFTRSARNVKQVHEIDDVCEYVLDTGKKLIHKRADGAIKLAIAMLKTIVEP